MEAWARPDARQREYSLRGPCSLGTPSTGEKEFLWKMPLHHVDYKLHRASQKEEEGSPPVLFTFIKSVPMCMCISVHAWYWNVCVHMHEPMHAEAREVYGPALLLQGALFLCQGLSLNLAAGSP